MNEHLSEQGVFMHLMGSPTPEDRQHAETCSACQAAILNLQTSLSHFRGAVRNWSERSSGNDRAAEMRWTVIPAVDNLERMLVPSLETPWYRSLWCGLQGLMQPQRPALMDITSKPVLVRDIWGQYGRQKKSWVMSFAMQSAVVVLLLSAVSTKAVQQKVVRIIPLFDPSLALEPKAPPAHDKMQGGGGGGDRSPLPASHGVLPKPALKQFTPPMAVVLNQDPKLAMEPTIIAPPDVRLPEVNAAQYGDPLSKFVIASNGSGSGGGIGLDTGGGVGSGKGPGFGPGVGSIGGGVFRVGGGVTGPTLIYKIEPEYSDEARKARHQGTVILYVEVDASGRAQNMRVLQSLGLGLDEKAMEAVRKWKFRPGTKDGRPVTVEATVHVTFTLL